MTETISKYNQLIYESFMVAFDGLPLACLVNKKFFCVHGGISDKLLNVKYILLRLKILILLIDFVKYLLKEHFVILFGQIP